MEKSLKKGQLEIQNAKLVAVDNQYPQRDYEVSVTLPEFTCATGVLFTGSGRELGEGVGVALTTGAIWAALVGVIVLVTCAALVDLGLSGVEQG